MEGRQSFFHTINCDEKDLEIKFDCEKMEQEKKFLGNIFGKAKNSPTSMFTSKKIRE